MPDRDEFVSLGRGDAKLCRQLVAAAVGDDVFDERALGAWLAAQTKRFSAPLEPFLEAVRVARERLLSGATAREAAAAGREHIAQAAGTSSRASILAERAITRSVMKDSLTTVGAIRQYVVGLVNHFVVDSLGGASEQLVQTRRDARTFDRLTGMVSEAAGRFAENWTRNRDKGLNFDAREKKRGRARVTAQTDLAGGSDD